ncbi:thiamine pyrophosphate-dependent dehydrogenase E1 component subunit alpha [Temperatibacter marinus]|uniref:Thiamine pyrophosphate-dependent dehydrogenase E1 component subunit alpha n=1 Tax=Temperatibacter marinus TaxID=1456591 RepID=A0AA52EJ80_9PROT|nr:thiamine pyrophosphate-dependent dehydrogenase E1 component subunit alpha [Temperatibacter marinus]WND04158.1 thiamine pyrophosphate-dependent dehydrogenase E1 component subunit alpha [Temperatibacter marinus]
MIEDYQKMLTIRLIEQKLTELYDAGRVPGLIHPALGGEALAVGVAHLLTPGIDMIFSSHRCHGHALAGGIDIKGMIREILGRSDGINKGRAGTQHLNDPRAPENGSLFVSGNGIVGGQVPLALGAALSAKRRQTGGMAVVFFGDGAVNQGGVLESLNLAMMQKLPVLFICENNGVALSTASSHAAAEQDFSARAQAVGMQSLKINGRDLGAVKSGLADRLSFIRGGAPLFLEASVDRLCGHFHQDEERYRQTKPMINSPDDPLVIMKDYLMSEGLDEDEIYHITDSQTALISTLLKEAVQ